MNPDLVVFPVVNGLPELILIKGVPQGVYQGKGGWHGCRLPTRCACCMGHNYIRRGKYGSGGLMWTCRDCLSLFVTSQ